jgi:hypothetical protein
LKGSTFRAKIFKGIDTSDMARTRYILKKMLSNLGDIENAVIESD